MDRNVARACAPSANGAESLSARRAWIEKVFRDAGGTESVCRSPQGERG